MNIFDLVAIPLISYFNIIANLNTLGAVVLVFKYESKSPNIIRRLNHSLWHCGLSFFQLQIPLGKHWMCAGPSL